VLREPSPGLLSRLATLGSCARCSATMLCRLIDVPRRGRRNPEKLEAHAQLKATIEMIAQPDGVEYKPEMGELEISQRTV
jgi:hypothetical protein